jgi:hypothetical protein
MVREMVGADPELRGRLVGRINEGVDFKDIQTGKRYEMTTEGALPKHMRLYGRDIIHRDTSRAPTGGGIPGFRGRAGVD